MTNEQKRAWFIVGCFIVSLATFLALFLRMGFPEAWGGLALFGLGAVIHIFLFRGKGKTREVPEDERDRLIARNGLLAGGTFSYSLFIMVCMGLWAFLRFGQGKTTVNVDVLPLIVALGAVVFHTAQAITVLILYNRVTDDAQI